MKRLLFCLLLVVCILLVLANVYLPPLAQSAMQLVVGLAALFVENQQAALEYELWSLGIGVGIALLPRLMVPV
ncbi:MAG: hypothetical protein H6832_11275 [Planctomycetes bacterium]|nr:hypothetical protein [Planctomycetota bacterium]MCB9918971.1 hypothetical protein [Planctomycetota bacterium]